MFFFEFRRDIAVVNFFYTSSGFETYVRDEIFGFTEFLCRCMPYTLWFSISEPVHIFNQKKIQSFQPALAGYSAYFWDLVLNRMIWKLEDKVSKSPPIPALCNRIPYDPIFECSIEHTWPAMLIIKQCFAEETIRHLDNKSNRRYSVCPVQCVMHIVHLCNTVSYT